MKVILFGATGMVGQGVLRECLRDEGVESVLDPHPPGAGDAARQQGPQNRVKNGRLPARRAVLGQAKEPQPARHQTQAPPL
jgi:uncharacterized protein YbjT (DUF2867 family)